MGEADEGGSDQVPGVEPRVAESHDPERGPCQAEHGGVELIESLPRRAFLHLLGVVEGCVPCFLVLGGGVVSIERGVCLRECPGPNNGDPLGVLVVGVLLGLGDDRSHLETGLLGGSELHLREEDARHGCQCLVGVEPRVLDGLKDVLNRRREVHLSQESLGLRLDT